MFIKLKLQFFNFKKFLIKNKKGKLKISLKNNFKIIYN